MAGYFSKLFNPLSLVGPLFSKELRVSSRRKRNYLLRFAYIVSLSVFVAIVWLSTVHIEGPLAYQKSRMAVAGKTIVTTIVVFQFVAAQLIAVIALSTAISDEIYNRTLGVLMTTPISGFHIVTGKLLSKLLQLILLLGISLPLLAIVRVFGGVPWDYVLSSVCITFTASLFAGSLSLYLSIRNRRAYVVIIKTMFVLLVLFAFLPALFAGFIGLVVLRLGNPIMTVSAFTSHFSYINPFGAMSLTTLFMLSPGLPAGVSSFHWPLHCALMLCLSVLLVARSVKVVRKVALQQATGQLDIAPKHSRRKKIKKLSMQFLKTRELVGAIRPVKGWPVLWKELRSPMIQGPDRTNSIIGLAAAIIALLLTYAVCEKDGCLSLDFVQVSYVLLFVLIAMIFHIVLSASVITYEKESRAWPILLATSMDDWQILFSKAGAVFCRSAVIWLLLSAHLILFVLVGYINPVAIAHLFLLVTWLAVFLTGSGLYFSARFRRTTSAVVASLAFALTLWIVIPILLGLVSEFTNNEYVIGSCLSAHPVTQAAVIMSGATGAHNTHVKLSGLEYNWPFANLEFVHTTAILLIIMLIYTSLGILFAWRAKCRFRRNIF